VLQGHEKTFSVGDLLSAGEAGSIFAHVSFVSGSKLHDLTMTIKRIIPRMHSLNQIHICSVLLSIKRAALELMDRPSEMTKINNELMNDETFENYLESVKYYDSLYSLILPAENELAKRCQVYAMPWVRFLHLSNPFGKWCYLFSSIDKVR